MSANEWIAPTIGVIGTILGVVLGAVISYYIQTKTQRNAWKREYSVKIAETVYAALYSNIKAIKSLLETGKFEIISFGTWQEFQNDHRHLQVRPDKFRKQLDEFLKKADDYDSDVMRLINNVFPDIAEKAAKKTFNLTIQDINISVKGKQPSGRFEELNYNLVSCLRERKHPRDLLMESYPESEIISFSVNFGTNRITVGTPDEAEFNEFWKLCLQLEDENEICKRVIQKQRELLNESKNIFIELQKRIVNIIP
jgi:hypothetical protein